MKMRLMKRDRDLLYPCGHPVGCWYNDKYGCGWCMNMKGFLTWGCMDCGVSDPERLSGLAPTKQWRRIVKGGHGILCANCMIRRARAKGAIGVRIQFIYKGSDLVKWPRAWRA